MDLKTLLKQMDEVPKVLTKLMEDLKVDNKVAFKKVLRGFPEKSINTYKGDIGVCYLKKINFGNDYSSHIRLKSLKIILGFVCKGTKTQAHDKINKLCLDVLEKFMTDNEWVTLKNNVKATFITNHEIFIENRSKTLLTTAIFELEAQLRYHTNERNNQIKGVKDIRGDVSLWRKKKMKKK
jgi:hypothetical protein